MARTSLLAALAVAAAASPALLLCGPRALPVLAAGKNATVPSAGWSPEAAAHYLDSREIYWQGWDRAQKDHGTLCVSCHTQASYGLARPELRTALSETSPTPSEDTMLASIRKRVRMWKDMKPFYSDALSGPGKEVESRDAESVLNAIILASYDQRQGRLNDTTRLAFAHAWALQSKTGPDAGAWVWQNFDYTPWESKESQYYWAALFAETVANAPDNYRRDPQIAGNLAALRAYLTSHYNAQPLLNKIVLLWASAKSPGLLTHAQRKTLFVQIEGLQRPDGGWSLNDLGTWHRRDNTPEETRPDGYATGLIVLVLEKNGVKSRANSSVSGGLAWLMANQDKTTGAWPAWSLNKNRDPKSNTGEFMSDAATSYAVMALESRR